MYRLDHRYFDQDIDNCILLTNEHIKRLYLVDQDVEIYKRSIQDRTKKRNAFDQKRKESLVKYKAAKKQRLLLEIANDN